jgi:organic radical activating enzyme
VQVEEEKQPEVAEEEQPAGLEEITEEESVVEEVVQEQAIEKVEEQVQEAIEEAVETGEPLPENIQKVVDFINETGGSLEDYVKLNQDFTSYDDKSLLVEYYKQTKPHLNRDEIDFLMEDNFKYNEEVDEEIDIKRKKLALKEQVASAKSHLDGLKSKYYEEVKAGSRLAPEQQKAVDFFSRYNKELEETNKTQGLQQKVFQDKTKEVFNDQFKGFEYKVGEKKYRFNVKDAAKVKDTQSDINNFVKKFLNEKK